MKKHYFIDYENVREHGLAGLSLLDGDSYVHLMFTNNANKISLDALINSRGAHIEVMKTPAGKQSLDMQLVSYLGYVLGREPDGDCSCCIVSKDKGYVNTARFWNSMPGLEGRVSICPAIADSIAAREEQPAEEAAPAQEAAAEEQEVPAAEDMPAAKPAEPAQDAAVRGTKKTRRGGRKNRKEQEAPAAESAAPAEEPAPAYEAEQPHVPEAPEAMPGEEAAELRAERPEKPAPAENPEARQEPKPSRDEENLRVELNNKLMKALSETGMDNKLVGQITSLCIKNSGKENHRQVIYRGIISKLGQKKGLEVYRVIKGII